MAKPSIQNITTTQTFQNWFDKTNEMVNIFRDAVVTASVAGDTTTGNATVLGNFEATNLLAETLLSVDSIDSYTPGSTIEVSSPIQITTSSQPIAATFNYAASGGRARFTNGLVSWDIGMEDSGNARFLINTGTGTPRFAISTQGQVEAEALVIRDDIQVQTDLFVDGTAYIENLVANNVTITSASGDFSGTFTGDVYNEAGGKILENGSGGAIPATFTGNVNGTVSSLTNHTTDNLAEGSTNLYYTDARVQAIVDVAASAIISADGIRNIAHDAFQSGTGVTFTGPDADDKITVSIGQGVGSYQTVTFGEVRSRGNIIGYYGSSSDIRLKENITRIDGALDKISKINGYTFNMKGRDETMAGVIAQELMEVFPNAVFEVEDEEAEEKFLAVRYNDIIGLLIEAIKELQSKIEK